MKKALVTGAGGFIGSHLVEELLQKGYQVRALLRYNSQSSIGNLEDLPETVRDSVEIVWGDLRDAASVLSACSDRTHIFHLGALVAIPYSYRNPTDFVKVNALGTTHVLNAALHSSTLERLVVTSTSEVYGTAQYVPIDESHPIQGQSPYSASKIAADHIAESYARSFDLPVAVLRPFNTYGPRQSMRAIIPTIIVQLLKRDVVKLGNLTPRRDLNFVRDTAKAFRVMGEHPNVPFGEPLNVGAGKDISIGELFEKLRELTGSNAELQADEQRIRPDKSEVHRLLCDASRAKSLIDWSPEYSLDEGLEETIEWIKAKLEQFRADEYYI